MKNKKLLLFAIIPLLFLLFIYQVRKSEGPFWIDNLADPDYEYLLNSLNIAEYTGPGHTDHPGTTVQIFGGIVLRASQIVNRLGGDTSHIRVLVISNPEFYMQLLHWTLMATYALSLLAIGILLYRATGSFWGALLYQLTPFLFPHLLYTFTSKFDPEPFLGLVGMWLGYFYILQVCGHRPLQERKFSILVGVLTACGIITKLPFIPLLIIPLFIFREKRSYATYFASLIFGVALFSAPIGRRYPLFLNWVYNLATHKGIYGGGEAGLVDFKAAGEAFKVMLGLLPIYFLTLLTAVILTVWYLIKVKNISKQDWAIVGLTAGIFCQLLLVLKHADDHYLVSSLYMVAAYLFIVQYKIHSQNRTYKKIFATFVICAISFPIHIDLSAYKSFVNFIRLPASEVATVDKIVRESYSSCAQITYHPYSLTWALQLANGNAHSRHNNPLGDIYPNSYSYRLDTKEIVYWNKIFSLQEIKEKYSCIVFYGMAFTGDYAQYYPDLPLKVVYSGPQESIYVYFKPN